MKNRKYLVGAIGMIVLATGIWAAAGAGASPAKHTKAAATKVTLQLKWVTQAQFAGYYAAEAKGYYKQAGLDVKIKVGGPDITPEQVVAGGQAEFGLDWLPSLLAFRDKGTKLDQHRAGVQSVRDDAADLEGQRHQDDRADAREEGRQLALGERVRAVRRADPRRDGSVEEQGRHDRQAAVRHELCS